MPWWSSSRRGEDCNWPSHMERRRDGSTKVKAKRPFLLYAGILEEELERKAYHLRGGRSGGSVVSSSSCSCSHNATSSSGSIASGDLTHRVHRLPLTPPPAVPMPPRKKAPAAVVTVDIPSESASTVSDVGGSDTESYGSSQSGDTKSSNGSSSSSGSSDSGSRRGSTFKSTANNDSYSYNSSVRTASLAPTVVTVSDDGGDDEDVDLSAFLPPSSPVPSTFLSASSPSSPLPVPRQPSPSPPSPFLRPRASPTSSDSGSASTVASTASSRLSAPASTRSVSIVDCKALKSSTDANYGVYGGYRTSCDRSYDGSFDTCNPTSPAFHAPEKPIALRRTLTRTQPLPRLHPIQTNLAPYDAAYSPYSSYVPSFVPSSVWSPSLSSHTRVRRANRAPRSPWAITRTPGTSGALKTPKTPRTPKAPKTPRLARAPRAVRMQTIRREKPRIIQAPRVSRTPRTPFSAGPVSDTAFRGQLASPAGSYVRTESLSRERIRQQRAALAARKAEATAAVMAAEAALDRATASVHSSRPESSSRTGSSVMSTRSSFRSASSRPVVVTHRARKSTDLGGLSRNRTEPIRSPLVETHRPAPRTPRRRSVTAGLREDPRVREDATWDDYFVGTTRRTGTAQRSSRTFEERPDFRKEAAPKRIFGGYYETEVRSTPRSSRPLDNVLAFLRPRENSGSKGRDADIVIPSPRSVVSMAPRVAAARRKATQQSELLDALPLDPSR
ncbi:hypothetical protein SBRCBS47491_006848 [Sporothrix bragantina]|uniref:Uncharacterized protein n=1 Tax=Sporothrix bragantina TaxID=671064 RepID=A0ABP0C8D3_9PEZI